MQVFLCKHLILWNFTSFSALLDNLDYSISSILIPRTHTRFLNYADDSYTNWFLGFGGFLCPFHRLLGIVMGPLADFVAVLIDPRCWSVSLSVFAEYSNCANFLSLLFIFWRAGIISMTICLLNFSIFSMYYKFRSLILAY